MRLRRIKVLVMVAIITISTPYSEGLNVYASDISDEIVLVTDAENVSVIETNGQDDTIKQLSEDELIKNNDINCQENIVDDRTYDELIIDNYIEEKVSSDISTENIENIERNERLYDKEEPIISSNDEMLSDADNSIEFMSTNIIESGMCGDNLTWEFLSDGTLSIYGNGSMTDYPIYDTNTKTANTPWGKYRNDITSLNIADGVTSIGIQAFSGLEYVHNNNLILPESLVSIGVEAFRDCSNISGTLTLPDNIERIGRGCFENCKSIEGEIKIPLKMKKLEREVFKGCISLTRIVIHKDVKEIMEGCFADCKGIEYVVFEGIGFDEVSNNSFYDFGGRCYFHSGQKNNYTTLMQQLSKSTWIAFEEQKDIDIWENTIASKGDEEVQFKKEIKTSSSNTQRTQISSLEQLSQIEKGKYVLVKDIIIDKKYNWKGVEISEELEIDGQGYSIINESEMPLFSSISNSCSIKNLRYVQKNEKAIGMIGEFSIRNKDDDKEYVLLIDNCCASGVSSKSGFIGSAESFSTGRMAWTDSYDYANTSIIISNCSVNMSIISLAHVEIGGFIGDICSIASNDGSRYYYNGEGHLNIDISNSISDVVIAGGYYSGGFIGYVNQEGWGEGHVSFSNCTVNGLVQGVSSGGFIGGEYCTTGYGGYMYNDGLNLFSPTIINCDSLCHSTTLDMNGGNFVGNITGRQSTVEATVLFKGLNYYDYEYIPVSISEFVEIEGINTIYHISKKNEIENNLNIGFSHKLSNRISFDDDYEISEFNLDLNTYCVINRDVKYNNVVLTVELPESLSFADITLNKKIWNLGTLTGNEKPSILTRIPLRINTKEYIDCFKIKVAVVADGYKGISDELYIPVKLINDTPDVKNFNYDIYMANMLVETQRSPYNKYEDIYKNHNMCQQILDGANTSDEFLMQMWKSDFLIGWVKDPKCSMNYEVTMSDYYFALLIKMIKDSGEKTALGTVISVENEMNDLYEKLFDQTDNLRKATKLSDAELDIPVLKEMLTSKVIKYKSKSFSVPKGDSSIYDWVSDYMEVVFKSATTISDAVEQTQNICMLYALESSYKEAIQEMYKLECGMNTDICLRNALERVINCMNNSPDEFLFFTGRMTGEFLFDLFWKETVMKSIEEMYPVVKLVFIAVDTGHEYANVVANTDEIIDAEYNAIMTANITSLIWTTYLRVRTEYINNKNEENAKRCIAASKLYENACRLNIEIADEYVEAVRNSYASWLKFKVRSWFTGTNNLDETIKCMNSEKQYINITLSDVGLYCIEQLNVDYPNTGLYEYVKNGGKTNVVVKEVKHRYEIACPVSVTVSSQYGMALISDDIMHSDGYTIIEKKGDKKIVYCFEDEDLTIDIKGLDDGFMTCKIESYSDDCNYGQNKEYYSVPVSADLEYKILAFSNEDSIEESKLPVDRLLDVNNTEVESYEDTVLVDVDGGYFEESDNDYFIKGEVVNIRADIPYGEKFVRWESDRSLTGIIDDVTLPHTLLRIPDEDLSIRAVTEKAFETYTISAICGEGGFMNLTGELSVAEGGEIQLYIIEGLGYEFKDVIVDGESVGALNLYKFDNITSDHTIEAIFEKKPIVKGDVTGDQQVAMDDVVKIARAVAGNLKLTDEEKEAADVTGDNAVAMDDVVKEARYVAGAIKEL